MGTTGKKILIIDDENDLRKALRTTLESAGYGVEEAENGMQGLSIAKTYNPDLILLDISMPRMTGHQVLRELQLHPSGKEASVILLTNSDNPSDIARGATLKSDDYIIKSQTSLQDILKKVKQHLAGYHD
jgi:DNA-binding response OmpR family regulator